MSTENMIHLGEIPVCSEAAVLPVIATETGTWAFMTTFNGAYQYIQFPATEGQKIVVPAKLNEDYTYRFKLYQPDNSLLNTDGYCAKTMPMLPDIDYVCPATGANGLPFTTGKLQFVASEGQTEGSYTELAVAKQVAVFVEGGMRQEGTEDDEYSFDSLNAAIVFNTPLIEGQKITIIYFK